MELTYQLDGLKYTKYYKGNNKVQIKTILLYITL